MGWMHNFQLKNLPKQLAPPLYDATPSSDKHSTGRKSSFLAGWREQSPARDDSSQWAVLAVLRFVLAMIVLIAHARGWYSIRSRHLPNPEVAVIAFLIVSGYSIAASLERKSAGFYLRRIRRILPILIACLLLSLIPCLLFGDGFAGGWGQKMNLPTVVQFLGNVALLHQAFGIAAIPMIGPIWSLAVEARFYALAPLLRRSQIFLGALLLASGITWAFHFKSLEGAMMGQTILFGWAWLLGFWYYGQRGRIISAVALAVIGGGLLCKYVPYRDAFQNPLPGHILVVAVFVASRYCRFGSRAKKAMNWLGDISYPLYLAHLPVLLLICTVEKYRPGRWIAVATCVVAAIALDRFVDKPIQARMAKWR